MTEFQLSRVWEGHDFSRAVSRQKWVRALAPEVSFFPSPTTFSASCLAAEGTAISDRTTTTQRVAVQFEAALKGHGFAACGKSRSCARFWVAQRFSAAVSVLF
jgi:hypothetical protein